MLTGWLTQARWSVLGQQPLGKRGTTAGRSGHRAIHRNCRWLPLWASGLGRRKPAQWSSRLPTRLPRALWALAHEALSRRGRASPSGPAGSHCRQVRAGLVLTGRATRVPQAAVTSSIQRTVTVNLAGPISWSSLARPARTHPANVPDKDEVLARVSGLWICDLRSGLLSPG